MNTAPRLLLLAIALVIGAAGLVRAGDNPDPCLEPWRCKQEPFIVGSWGKTSFKVCPGSEGTWTAFMTVNQGIRERCEEEKRDVGVKDVTWSWKIEGPETASGDTNSISFTPRKCGSYTVIATAHAKAEDPCKAEDLTFSTDHYPFTVPCEACSVALGSAKICPGKCKDIPIAITNPETDCTFTYTYRVTAGDGDPLVEVVDGEGSLTVGPGATETAMVTVCADDDSPRGTKVLHVDVYGTVDPAKHCEADGAVEVSEEWALQNPDDVSICLGDTDPDAFDIDNTGECDVTIDWKISQLGGAAGISVFPASGQVIVPANSTVTVDFLVSADPTSPGGDARFLVEADSGAEVQLSAFNAAVHSLVSVTCDAADYAPWDAGSRVTATVQITGSARNIELVYQLYDVELGRVVWEKASSSLTETIPIAVAGRYRVRVVGCHGRQTVETTPPFVFWTVDVAPASVTYQWDDIANIANEEEWQSLSRLNLRLKEIALFLAHHGAEEVAEHSHEFTEKTQHLINTAQEKAAESERIIAETQARVDAASRDRIAERARLADQQALRDRQAADLANQRRLLQQTEEQIADLRRQLEAATSNSQRARLTAEIRRAERIAERYRSAVTLITESLARTVSRISAVEAAIRSLDALITDLGDVIARQATRLAAARAALAEMGGALGSASVKLIHIAAVGLQGAIALYDVIEGIHEIEEYDDILAENQERLREAEDLEREHKAAIESLIASNAHRETPPLRKRVTLTTRPGSVPLKFLEFPDFWITKDRTIPLSEGRWDFEHLVLISENLTFYDGDRIIPSPAGVTGALDLDLYAYGNLGQSKVYSFVRGITTNRPITAKSDGLDEDAAIALVRTQFAKDEAEARDRKALFDEYIAAVSVVSGVITLGVIVAYAAGIVAFSVASLVGAVVAVAALAIILVVSIISWIFGPSNPPIIQSIIDRFPKLA